MLFSKKACVGKDIFGGIKRFREKEVLFHEDDISAQKAFTCKGSRIQGKNEYSWREKSFSGQTCKRKKEIVCIVAQVTEMWPFSLLLCIKLFINFYVRDFQED